MSKILEVVTTKKETTLSTRVVQNGFIDDVIIAAGDSIALIVEALEKDDVKLGRTREEFLEAIYQKAIHKMAGKK